MAVWFDAHNTEHCKAYREYQKTGIWPKDLELLDMDLGGQAWELSIRGTIVQAWIDQVLEEAEKNG